MLKIIYAYLLKLDGPVLKSDPQPVKFLKRKILKPIGFFFRKKHFQLLTR